MNKKPNYSKSTFEKNQCCYDEKKCFIEIFFKHLLEVC